MNDTDVFIGLAAGGAVLALFLIALTVALLVGVARRTARERRVAARPSVLVYTRQDPSSPSILQIVIENVGGGTARDVRFKLSRPIPIRAFGLTVEDAEKRREPTMQDFLLQAPIPALPAGARRVIDWGQYGGLYRAIGDKAIGVRARYKGGGRKLKSVSRLEVASFFGCAGSDRGVGREVAKVLGKIDRTLCSLNSNVRPLRVKPAGGVSRNGSTRTTAPKAGDDTGIDIFIEAKS